ncbi:hypothetical protein AB9U01_25665 [Pseudomonas qingdaonensis]|uniref:hypothetical protein n=1 Tax=Pseudomonas qingdaonensis TaxID=2056231 RepID=UPI0035183273
MTIDKQELKALVDRVKTDRRFCADDHHQILADGVQSLLAENEMLTAQRLMHVRLNLSLRARRKVWVSACEKAEDQLLDALAERDQLKAENEALRNALGDLLALYEDDEGCRNLPEYIAGRAAIAKEALHG